MARSIIQKRRQARFLLIQALYQWQLSGTAVHEIEQHYLLDEHVQKADVPYFRDLFNGIMQDLEDVDAAMPAGGGLDGADDRVDPRDVAGMGMRAATGGDDPVRGGLGGHRERGRDVQGAVGRADRGAAHGDPDRRVVRGVSARRRDVVGTAE